MIKYIYVFFVGLFVAIFIGMGIAVFYESPDPPKEPSWFSLRDSGKYELTESERNEELVYNSKLKEFNETTMSNYNRNVSIIVIVCSVLVLIIALLFTEIFGIIADGLLLGSIFTLLYGVGRGIAVDSNIYRFVVASLGLIVTITIGYLKFVTGKAIKASETT